MKTHRPDRAVGWDLFDAEVFVISAVLVSIGPCRELFCAERFNALRRVA